MVRDLLKPLGLTMLIAGPLALTVFLIGRGTGWPDPENPPRQGEALDAKAYVQGNYVYSHGALAQAIREPFNTWTNLAFVRCGALLLTREGLAPRRQAGLALIAVGIGSFLYHASSSRTLRHWDVGAMYWLYLMLIVLAVGVLSERFRDFFNRSASGWMIALPILAIWITINRNAPDTIKSGCAARMQRLEAI
jgi:hypothetical protein